MAKRKVVPIAKLSAGNQELYNVLSKEGDIAMILVGGAYLDATLAAMLDAFLVKSSVTEQMLDTGALSTFVARTSLCYTAGLIAKEVFQDLCIIGEIRNHCAHHHQLTQFRQTDVAALCAKLKFIESPVFHPFEGWIDSPRSRFHASVVFILQRLQVDALAIKRRERWPAPKA